MKIAHLILIHNNPAQLERLIKRLTYQDDRVFIHLDKKTPFKAFSHLERYDKVTFIRDRVHVAWGSFNMVQATINGFQEIISSGTEYDYINLLSGCDYPLQTNERIHEFFEANPGKAFMSYLRMPDQWQEALPRLTRYHLTNYRFPGSYKLEKLINRLFKPRRMPDNLIPVGRSQWFTLSAECVKYILLYWRSHPQVRQFLRFTWGPDEFAFQTILYNSDYRDQMVNTNLRLMDWSAGGVSPKTLMMEDKSQIMSSDKLYARKFDANKHADILDVIDQKLEANRAADLIQP